MVSTIAPSANYYEILGIAPTASEQDIQKAFAQQMHGFRPMADMARLGLAFATLRDPAKRRAYDEEIGIGRAREQAPAVTAVSFRLTGAYAAPARAVTEVERVQVAEEAAAPFIATSLPEPAPPEAHVRNEPAPVADRSTARHDGDLDRLLGQLQQLRNSKTPSASESGDEPFRINRTMGAVGALLAGTVAIGVWAGANAGNSPPEKAVQATTSVAVPPAKPASAAMLSPPPQMPQLAAFNATSTSGARPEPAAARSTRREQRSAARRAAAHPSLVDVAESSIADGVSLDSAVAPATAAAAPMPLPNSVIARTIDRIGYSCGSVASTSPVESGASGTYTVTCTSGHSYQAKPVGGRYRFSRIRG